MKIFAGNNPPIGNLVVPLATLQWRLGDMLSSSDSPDVLLSSFSVNDEEIVDIRKCFDGVTHLFAFGRSTTTSEISVHLIYFISSSCGKELTLADIRAAYDENRVYNNTTPLELSIAGETFSGFLTGMTVGQADPVTQTCGITFRFVSAEDN